MSEGISDQVTDLSKRVQALEGSDMSDTLSVARITKIYGSVKVVTTVRIRSLKVKFCDNGLYCDPALYI